METINVLIVEDNEDHAESLKLVLQSRSEIRFVVETVHTLRDALIRIPKGGIDVVLLDLNLSDARGVSVVDTLNKATKDIGILVLTGWGGDEIENPVRNAGADDILHKPANPFDISSKLQSIVIYRRNAKEKKEIESILKEMGTLIMRLSDLEDIKKDIIKDASLSGKLEIKR